MNRILLPVSHIGKPPVIARHFFQQLSPASKRHHERKLIRYPASLLYEVVSDVEHYFEFVPWCQKSKILQKSDSSLSAELTVGFKYLTEQYVSEVQLQPPRVVTAQSNQTNLFEFLRTEWKFTPAQDPNCTWVSFQVDFKFRSALYNELSEFFMNEVVHNMVKAFEERCKYLAKNRKASSCASAV